MDPVARRELLGVLDLRLNRVAVPLDPSSGRFVVVEYLQSSECAENNGTLLRVEPSYCVENLVVFLVFAHVVSPEHVKEGCIAIGRISKCDIVVRRVGEARRSRRAADGVFHRGAGCLRRTDYVGYVTKSE